MAKSQQGRIAIALLCAFAVCCGVMYATSDGEADIPTTVRETVTMPNGLVLDTSAKRTTAKDVGKFGAVYTNTPNGRQRLDIYFHQVEAAIERETAERKSAIASVRAQMERNFAINQAERKKLKAMLLHKMAVNAKRAKDELETSMRHVQAQFAAAAKLANERNNANLKRSAAIRATVAKNKRDAARNLRVAVTAQQRSLAALHSKLNSRIDQTNKHVAANAAQIKSDAKKAKADLDHAVSKFDKKLHNASEEAKKGRSKLAAQMVSQDKATRAWASNKIKDVAASTAAQFASVRNQMAKDRHHADMLVKQMTTRIQAGLAAQRALEDKRFAKTVADIKAAKAEAKAKVEKFRSHFKVSLMHMHSVVKAQVTKASNRITQLSGVVQRNKLEQAKVNRRTWAEMKRMVKLGNKRFQAHLKANKSLKTLVNKRKADFQNRMVKMAARFNSQLSKVRKTMKKNRAHAEHMLAKNTGALYKALAKQDALQKSTHGDLMKANRRAVLDVQDAVRETQKDFGKRYAKLHTTIVVNDRKASKRIEKLTGVEQANAVKSRQGRTLLHQINTANHAEMKNAIRLAVHAGEKRMMALNKKMVGMNDATKAAMNMRITASISKLAKSIHNQVQGVRAESAAARAALKKEIIFAVKSMAAEAKKNLGATTKAIKGKFLKVQHMDAALQRASGKAREILSKKIAKNRKAAARGLADSVANMNRAQLAVKSEMMKKIKKTNTRVTAYADAMIATAKKTNSQMNAAVSSLSAKIKKAQAKAMKGIKGADAASAKRHAAALKNLRSGMKKALKASEDKFGKAYSKMAKDRASFDQQLAGSTSGLNAALSKQAALYDMRFTKSVKNVKRARKEAAAQVMAFRKSFTTSVNGVTSAIKAQETRLKGEIAVVSGEVTSLKHQQAAVNRHTFAEMKRIQKLSDARHSESKRARGKLRALMDAHKKAAAEEVSVLATWTQRKIGGLRHQAARNRRQAAQDLTRSTKALYAKHASNLRAQATANKNAASAIRGMQAKAQAGIRAMKKDFSSRFGTLMNTITANNRRVQNRLRRITGVVNKAAKAGAADRALIKKQQDAMNKDMQKAIVRSIQIGEAKSKASNQRLTTKLKATKKAMMSQISESVERAANMVFAVVQGGRAKIADNYLSVKAYSAAVNDDLQTYLAKGKGTSLLSIGDFLSSVAAISSVRTKPAKGIGAGAGAVATPFGAKKIKVNSSVSKINGLVNEYIDILTQVKRRWPLGIGRYLLGRLEESMQKKGVLQVVKGNKGSVVYVSGQSVGLRNKLRDLSKLSVKMPKYEASLAHLTAKLVPTPTKVKKVSLSQPEWQGN
jgi:hypothetical protein